MKRFPGIWGFGFPRPPSRDVLTEIRVGLLSLTEMNLQAVWPSGLRRRIQAPFRKGEGSNPSTVNCFFFAPSLSPPLSRGCLISYGIFP